MKRTNLDNRRKLSRDERIAYVGAVECLMNKPSRFPEGTPGRFSAFDDFAAVHYKITPMHHASATFLTWHRHYLQNYEDALHELCGYNGQLY